MNKTGETLEKLIEILATLRGPNGCPWDREQTHKDLNPYLLEEAHEVVDAVDGGDFAELKEELGDLLVHILFHSQLAEEDGKFKIEEVFRGACEKLIRRHPHVFGDEKAPTTKEVLINWEKIKQKENKEKKKDSLLDGLPKGLSALIVAFRLGEKSGRVGFDWTDTKGILKKVDEETKELHAAIQENKIDEIEAEYGDLLFTLANLGRFLKLDPETALRKATQRFKQRFQWIEKKAVEENLPLQSLSALQWNNWWEEAKKEV